MKAWTSGYNPALHSKYDTHHTLWSWGSFFHLYKQGHMQDFSKGDYKSQGSHMTFKRLVLKATRRTTIKSAHMHILLVNTLSTCVRTRGEYETLQSN